MAYCRSGRVGAIHSETNLDRGRVAALGRAKAHFTGPRRRQVLIYLGYCGDNFAHQRQCVFQSGPQASCITPEQDSQSRDWQAPGGN